MDKMNTDYRQAVDIENIKSNCKPPDCGQHLLLTDFIHEDLGLMLYGFLYIVIISSSIWWWRGRWQKFWTSKEETWLKLLKTGKKNLTSLPNTYIQLVTFTIVHYIIHS